MRKALLLLLLPLLVACKKPSGPQGEPADAAAEPESVPAAGTGRIEEPSDPVEALRKRTYVLLVDGRAVHAGTTAGIVTWDIEEASRPEVRASVVLPGSVSGLELLEGERKVIAAATGPTGVALVEVGDDGKLSVLSEGRWASAGGCHAAWRIRSAGQGKIYIACGSSGVAEADVSDPASPRVSRIIATGGYVRDLAILEGQATGVVAAAGRAGLVTVEFPKTGQPRIVSALDTVGEARAVEIESGLAYVANGAPGLTVVDIGKPASPTIVSTFDPEATDLARGITLSEGRVYLCMGESGLLILDIADPAAPARIGTYDPGRALNRVAVDGGLLYAANDDAGLLVLDVKDPASPAQIFPVQGD